MSLYRIWGVILRYLYLFKRSLDRQSDAFYWPTVDLVLWGITSKYFSETSANPGLAILIVISGIVLWIMVWRGQYEITVNILEDLWNKNLVNMFVSPLKVWEWIASFIFLSIGKSVISILFAGLIAFLLYHVKVFSHGFQLVPHLFLLLMAGWWVGLLVGALIIRFGGKVQQFAWSAVFLISPFSAIYYPVSALPLWAQKFAMLVPTSYIFEGAREVIVTGHTDSTKLVMALLLNILYLVLAVTFFYSSFRKILNKGLVKLY